MGKEGDEHGGRINSGYQMYVMIFLGDKINLKSSKDKERKATFSRNK
jgi:hypothetical protein